MVRTLPTCFTVAALSLGLAASVATAQTPAAAGVPGVVSRQAVARDVFDCTENGPAGFASLCTSWRGAITARSVSAVVFPAPQHVNVPLQFYVAAQLPNGEWFFKVNGAWQPLNGGTPAPALVATLGPEYGASLTVAAGEDHTAFTGAVAYVGYGTSYQEMVSSARYAAVYTVAP